MNKQILNYKEGLENKFSNLLNLINKENSLREINIEEEIIAIVYLANEKILEASEIIVLDDGSTKINHTKLFNETIDIRELFIDRITVDFEIRPIYNENLTSFD